MLSLPQCCLKLEGLHVAVPVDISIQNRSSCTYLDHVTGFMLDCSETWWSDWFSNYYQRSNPKYSIHTGKQVN